MNYRLSHAAICNYFYIFWTLLFYLKDLIYFHPVQRISFIARDPGDSRAFGYVYGSGEGKHQFYGIKTEKVVSLFVQKMILQKSIPFNPFSKHRALYSILQWYSTYPSYYSEFSDQIFVPIFHWELSVVSERKPAYHDAIKYPSKCNVRKLVKSGSCMMQIWLTKNILVILQRLDSFTFVCCGILVDTMSDFLSFNHRRVGPSLSRCHYSSSHNHDMMSETVLTWTSDLHISISLAEYKNWTWIKMNKFMCLLERITISYER